MEKILSWQKKYPELIGNIYCKGLIAGVFIKNKLENDNLKLDISLAIRS